MRRFLTLAVAIALIAGSATAAEPRQGLGRLNPVERDASLAVPGQSWVRIASADAVELSTAFAPAVENRPSVLLETDYYVYPWGISNINEPTVMLTIDANGFAAAATLYMYWEDRNEGIRRYISAADGLLDEGEVQDLFGVEGNPLPVYVPNLEDFVLFGGNGAFGRAPINPTGHYQFVFEVRDAMGEEVIARGNAMYNHVDDTISVGGDITTDTTWTSNNAYYLTTPTYVGGNPLQGGTVPTTLTIEPGTVVFASQLGQGTLVSVQGSELIADGTAILPIIFTTELAVGTRNAGLWGGLVLNGYAPINRPGGTAQGEGDSGPYGGDDPTDSCGVLRYVRVEFAGIKFSDQNELNGIALQACGTDTVVENVQVHFNADDGIEFFGGTTNAKNILITNSEDDSFDWTDGWQGTLFNTVAVQAHHLGDHGIEADNLKTPPSAEPRSNPTISNMTLIGNGHLDPASKAPGILFRRGTGANVRNLIVMNHSGPHIVVDGDESLSLMGGLLTVQSSIFFGNELEFGYDDQPTEDAHDAWLFETELFNREVNPMFGNPLAIVPDVIPLEGSPARDTKWISPPLGDVFGINEGPVDYIGGVDPNDPWIYKGWTTFSDN